MHHKEEAVEAQQSAEVKTHADDDFVGFEDVGDTTEEEYDEDEELEIGVYPVSLCPCVPVPVSLYSPFFPPPLTNTQRALSRPRATRS